MKGKIPNGYQIFAGHSPYFKINGYVSVTVEGKPDDSVVDFKLCTEDKKRTLSTCLSFIRINVQRWILS